LGFSEKDTLFQLPLTEFTEARNALAARLKKSGRDDEARDVKAIAKPSIVAWVVNQLYWRRRKVFDRLVASGEALRRAQSAQLSGKPADLREPLAARRETLSELARLAAETLKEASHNPAPDVMRRITTTLEALSIYGRSDQGPSPGRLTDEVDPPGFETLAALVPSGNTGVRRTGGQSTVVPFSRKADKTHPSKRGGSQKPSKDAEKDREARQAAAKAAAQQAERDLRDARQIAERAEAALRKAAAQVKTAEQAKEAAEKRLEEAAAALAQARSDARRIASEAESAADAVVDAERALAEARKQLD
jgi:hypothetical protein